MAQAPKQISRSLLRWYDKYRRRLPWRAEPGHPIDPYRVWLSEVMLQQTTVATVVSYYTDFLRRWPTVDALAKAPREDVLAAWAGLGYYSRARNLHACARRVCDELGGNFPDTEDGLRTLSGIGPYTAAAIAAIAFNRPANVVDGNVERVISRLFCVDEPLPKAKATLKELAAPLVPSQRPGDYAQALMDLGATICTPRLAHCAECPLAQTCLAHARKQETLYPKRAEKKARPTRYAYAFVLKNKEGQVWLRHRPEKGLLAGMLEVPTCSWADTACDFMAAYQELKVKHLPPPSAWYIHDGIVRHVFTHFTLEIQIATAECGKSAPVGLWLTPAQAEKQALPTLMRKILIFSIRDI